MEPTERKHVLVARELAGDIVAGRAPEGSIIPPADELAERFEVSRTVTREAIQVLADANLINVQHGKRTTVCPPSSWRFLHELVRQALGNERLASPLSDELFDARVYLELALNELAVTRATDEELVDILEKARAAEAELEDARRQGRRFVDQMVQADADFHGGVAAAAHNSVLTKLLIDVRRSLVPTWTVEELTDDERAETLRQHTLMAEALHDRDIQRLIDLVRRHLDWSHETTIGRQPEGQS